MSAPAYQFGPFRLDCGRYELLHEGHSLKLERKPMELLILLASRDGQLVTRDEIAKRLWDTDVFVDTEHGINTAIRKIRTVLRDDPEDPHYVQTVTGMGYRFVAPVIAEPIPLQTEPAAQTPAAPASEAEPPLAQPPSSRRRLWLAVAALATLAIVLALTIGPRSVLAHLLHRNGPAITSLAVLPLDNLSGDPNQDYFAAGITDELTTMLARNSTLRIVSRTSAMQFKGAHQPLPEIARSLNVDAIVEGSITRTEEGAHMTVQLIRADTDTHLWAQSYDRSPNEFAALPDDAARDIAAFLHSAATSPQPIRYVSPEAHDDYLHGSYLWFAGQNEAAGAYFKKAVDLQPDYALGWTGIAEYYGAGAVDGGLDPRIALPASDAAANRAIELDNTLPQAQLALCAITFFYHYDPLRADQECRAATQLDPKFAEAYHQDSKILAMSGHTAEAIEQEKKAMEMDPFGRPFALAYTYLLLRQYDAGITEARQRLVASPQASSLHWILSALYRSKGMKKESIAEEEKYLELTNRTASASAIRSAFDTGGYDAVLHLQIAELDKKSKTAYVSPMYLALLYAQLGNREKTLALLDESLQQQSPRLMFIQTDPAYDFLHADPRYRAIINHLGLPPAY